MKARQLRCVDNTGAEVSLERGRVYACIPDATLGEGEVRVLDESGESYIYARARFTEESEEGGGKGGRE